MQVALLLEEADVARVTGKRAVKQQAMRLVGVGEDGLEFRNGKLGAGVRLRPKDVPEVVEERLPCLRKPTPYIHQQQ